MDAVTLIGVVVKLITAFAPLLAALAAGRSGQVADARQAALTIGSTRNAIDADVSRAGGNAALLQLRQQWQRGQ